MSESTVKIEVLNYFDLPHTEGTYHRLLCLTGKAKGNAYFLYANRIIMGRDSTVDINTYDSKTSKNHAELIKLRGEYIVTDLSTQNGIFINNYKVKQHTLKNNDRLVLGLAVYKYNVLKIEQTKEGRALILNGIRKIIKSEDTDSQKEKEVKEEKTETKEKDDPSSNAKKQATKKKRIVIYGVVILVVAGLMLMDNKPSKKTTSNKTNKSKSFSEDVARAIKDQTYVKDKNLKKNLDIIFQRGLREARQGNYFRAINDFNLALILAPQNGRANYYLQKVTMSLNKEIEAYFLEGRRDYDALRYNAAINQYCSIMRLLQNNKNDERYKSAKKNIHEIELRLGMDKGEINCL